MRHGSSVAVDIPTNSKSARSTRAMLAHGEIPQMAIAPAQSRSAEFELQIFARSLSENFRGE
jgi:hypothetical protein